MKNTNVADKRVVEDNQNFDIDKWINFIKFDKDNEDLQKAELLHWCKYIGEEKYYSFFNLLQSEQKAENINFNDLKELAIYDSRIRNVLFPMLLIVEQHIRAQIGQVYRDEYIDMNDKGYKSKIKKLCTKNGKQGGIDFDIRNPNNLTGKISVFKFVSNNTLNLAVEIVKCIDEKELASHNYFNQGSYDCLSSNLEKLIALRNIIMHHNNIIGEKDIKNLILNLASFIPEYYSVVKYIVALNNQAKYFVDENEKTVQNYVVQISTEDKAKLYDKHNTGEDDYHLIKNHELKEIEEILGVNIVKRKSIDRVLTHISYGNERGLKNNSVYATKGDAVLKLIFVEKLTNLYPNLKKGELTEFKKDLESDETFANLEITKKLFKFLKHSLQRQQVEAIENSENQNFPREVLASLFEAISYEIYTEFGMNELDHFINNNFKDKFDNIKEEMLKREGNTNENKSVIN